MSSRTVRLAAAGLGLVAFLAHLLVLLRTHSFEGGLGLGYRIAAVLASGVVPYLVFVRLVASSRDRPATLRVETAPNRFVAPTFAQIPGARAILTMWFAALCAQIGFVADGDRVRLAGATQVILGGVTAALVFAVAITLLLRWGASVALDPEQITITSGHRSAAVRWDELSPGGPPNPGPAAPREVALFYRGWQPHLGPPRYERLPVGLLDVDPALLTTAIRQYVEQPELRSGIGTSAELDRLRAAVPDR